AGLAPSSPHSFASSGHPEYALVNRDAFTRSTGFSLDPPPFRSAFVVDHQRGRVVMRAAVVGHEPFAELARPEMTQGIQLKARRNAVGKQHKPTAPVQLSVKIAERPHGGAEDAGR